MHSEQVPKKLPTEDQENQENKKGGDNETKPPKEIEKKEEAKLRAKYPGLKPGGGQFLAQKRLSKGQKYFDSGDYAMAKAKAGQLPMQAASKGPMPPAKFLAPGPTTGDVIPTPENLPPRKPSLIQSKLASGSLS